MASDAIVVGCCLGLMPGITQRDRDIETATSAESCSCPPTPPAPPARPASRRQRHPLTPALSSVPATRSGEIGHTQLGDPERYAEIADLNAGRRQPDGTRLTGPDVIHPGWRLCRDRLLPRAARQRVDHVLEHYPGRDPARVTAPRLRRVDLGRVLTDRGGELDPGRFERQHGTADRDPPATTVCRQLLIVAVRVTLRHDTPDVSGYMPIAGRSSRRRRRPW